jgi:hypothetical protein
MGIINRFAYQEGFAPPQQSQKYPNYPIEAEDT